MLYVDFSEGRGRGVFADRHIQKNVLIDITHSWLLTPQDIELYDKTSLSGHWFDVPKKTGYGLLPLGFAALVNHSKDPNASLVWKERSIGYIGILTAIKDIQVDEEIFIDYGIETPSDWC